MRCGAVLPDETWRFVDRSGREIGFATWKRLQRSEWYRNVYDCRVGAVMVRVLWFGCRWHGETGMFDVLVVGEEGELISAKAETPMEAGILAGDMVRGLRERGLT